ncbi:MAG: DUF362 domain-containing protein [Desulfatibacillaceae bacterium]|nr:DUF362 domain-containing protein [Desulfatibacillaceae bacterium]
MTQEAAQESLVAVVQDSEENPAKDKYALLEEVLQKGRFFEVLEAKRAQKAKSKEDFFVVVKPNISMMLRRSDVGVYTDPFLVIHLLRLLLARGYTNLAVVESQNLYGNWFLNRSVPSVAARCGYLGFEAAQQGRAPLPAQIRVTGGGVDALVPLVDLTDEPVEKDFGREVGCAQVGKTWVEADFRISFCKMKTHFYSYYTLAVKNIYGCLPLQDKVSHYHCKRLVGLWTAHCIKALPVDWAVVDGFTAADGILGVKIKAVCNRPHTLIAGNDLLAVDHFGATLMNIKPEKSVLYQHLARISPPKPYRVEGAAKPLKAWRNTLYILVWLCQVIESSAWLMTYSGSLATGGYDSCFPHKSTNRGLFKRLLFFLTVPINILLDLGYLKLRFRQWLFARRLARERQLAPLLGQHPFLAGELNSLDSSDISRLAIILLSTRINGPVDFSGHYLIINNSPVAFEAGLSTANIAASALINYCLEQGIELKSLGEQLAALQNRKPNLFGRSRPWCHS